MSTIVVPGKHSYFLGARAELVDDSKELAADNWIRDHIQPNSALKWIVGRYVEADAPNRNRQMWTHAGLQMAEPTIKFAPMNLLHRQRDIVGTFTATKMMYPTGNDSAGLGTNPYIEALGAYWKAYFPDELKVIERAHAEGSLFFSMECVGDSITFKSSDGTEEETFDYAGVAHESYGKWNSVEGAIRQIDNPHFLGGALILPPERPGWANAEVTQISKYIAEHAAEAEQVYNDIETAAPHLSSLEIEEVMIEFMAKAKEDSIESEENPKEDLTDHSDLSLTSNSERGGDTVEGETYTEEEFQAAVAVAVADAITPVKDELEALKAAADADAIETKIAEIRAGVDEQVAELEKKLDTAVLEAQAATEERDAVVAWLEAEATAEAEATEIATRRDERLAQVKEVASFPEEYVESNGDRWASMDEESFEALLADYEAASSPKSDEEDPESDPLAQTAIKASRESETTENTLGADLAMLRGVDFSTL